MWWRRVGVAAAALALLAVARRHASPLAAPPAHDPPSAAACEPFWLATGPTRHARRHRRNILLSQLDQTAARLQLPPRLPRAVRQLPPEERARILRAEVEPAEKLLAEAACFVQPSDISLLEQVTRHLRDLRNATAIPSTSALSTSRQLRQRPARRGWKASGAPSDDGEGHDVRVTRGLGVFAGADFPCDERDAHLGAPWAQGACLLLCQPHAASSTAPRCGRAVAVCRRHPTCRTVDINVEGSVATLKSETELSRRTSWVKQVSLSRNLGDSAPGVDAACEQADVRLPRLHGAACTINCPALNCTRAVELCYLTTACQAVDISFGIAGRAAVARLRYRPT
ncbi:hypothetical protein AB1Y20_011951 [Prymnesium parvum]|uniref:Uncharacterized protein n=1 Tax=Prymnesium parvum TaxID=97485 RepID=A0AB34IN44_PRYPA